MSNPTHGLYGTRNHPSSEWTAWRNARERTTNPRSHQWERYGARGIRMADEWLHDFAAFLAHVGPKPTPIHSLDRIDNDRGYEPGNVRWATPEEQANNRRARRTH